MIPPYMFEPKTELGLFILSIVIGILFALVFDALRVIRIIFPHKSWMIFIEDMLFMLFCGFWFFIFSMTSARGQLRAFLLAGNILGFFLYIFTVGELVKRFVTKTREAIIAFLKKVYNLVLRCILRPVFLKIAPPIRKLLKKRRRTRKKSEKSAKKVLKV